MQLWLYHTWLCSHHMQTPSSTTLSRACPDTHVPSRPPAPIQRPETDLLLEFTLLHTHVPNHHVRMPPGNFCHTGFCYHTNISWPLPLLTWTQHRARCLPPHLSSVEAMQAVTLCGMSAPPTPAPARLQLS
jgi:hypothetical protein